MYSNFGRLVEGKQFSLIEILRIIFGEWVVYGKKLLSDRKMGGKRNFFKKRQILVKICEWLFCGINYKWFSFVGF